MPRPLILAFVLAAAAGTAAAELSQRYRTWLDGPEGFLVTKAERKAFEKLTGDAEAEAFIALFWARRDPDLSTRVNEYRQQFDARVAKADREYSYENHPGRLTDRGKLLILLGEPDYNHMSASVVNWVDQQVPASQELP